MNNLYEHKSIKDVIKKHKAHGFAELLKEINTLQRSPETFKKSKILDIEIPENEKNDFLRGLIFVFAKNYIELHKSKKIKMNKDVAQGLLTKSDTLDRGHFLCDLCYVMNKDEWCQLFIEEWTSIETVDFIAEKIHKAIKTIGIESLQKHMNESNRKAWDELPETLTVYRGCSNHGEYGMSWSLNKEVANKFAYRKGEGFNSGFKIRLMYSTVDQELQETIKNHKPNDSYVLTGTVNKKDCIVFLDGSEKEIFTQSAIITNEEIYKGNGK